MKSLTSLWQVVADELATLCHTSTVRDYKTVSDRVEEEGVSFLTITLPNFGKGFERSLDRGQVVPDFFTGFRWRRGLPLFLGGFLGRIFDAKTGLLLEDPCKDSIFAVRQLTLMFGKISIPCTEARNRKALQAFLECEKELQHSDELTPPDLLTDFKRVSLLLFGDVLSRVDKDVYEGKIVPRHGPGATADGLRGNAKFHQTEWPARMEPYFPFLEMALPNARYYSLVDHVEFLEPGEERPVKVTLVPKTQKTPRIIAIEPTCMQYVQQGLMERFVDYLQRSETVAGMIGFDDQSPNQRLAEEGSRTGRLATLDLSEASDRVSYRHVRLLMSNHPHLWAGVDACRSTKADVQGEVISLSKFASMGSALTFPIEAMVFLTIIFIGLEKWLNHPLSRDDMKSFKDKVRVYGDDLIVPADSVASVIHALEAFGFKINKDKSFWTGKFRESCGKEYYDGTDVSIIRCRQMLPRSRKDVPAIVSLVSFRNQCYYAGLWKVADRLDRLLARHLSVFPTVARSSAVLGRHSVLDYSVDKLSADTHAPLVRGYVVKSRLPVSQLDDVDALLKWFLKRGDKPYAADHLERSGRPKSVDIKLRWASPF